ncbi:hypothetical protein OPV22_028305 [Ensete ventricosum]|uniref:Uncharacterized protein n=1 Tax=Ensete ventricosum TaxID=4639 RepID=A0AAV8Q801_ENSVE|nr:hypothetical protein OPV22_028305 [Ensete ventricosum]
MEDKRPLWPCITFFVSESQCPPQMVVTFAFAKEAEEWGKINQKLVHHSSENSCRKSLFVDRAGRRARREGTPASME